MTYKTSPRTRQAVYGLTVLFGGGLLAATVWRWTRTHERLDLIVALWVVGVAWATVRILRGLERLEVECSEPTEAMELLLYAASVLPIAGYVPLLLYFAR